MSTNLDTWFDGLDQLDPGARITAYQVMCGVLSQRVDQPTFDAAARITLDAVAAVTP